MITKRQFLKTGIIGAVIGFFAPKVLAKNENIPTSLNGGEFVLSKESVESFGRTGKIAKDAQISIEKLSKLIQEQVKQTLIKESRSGGILSNNF